MNIEDLIISLSLSNVRLNAWDEKLVHSFYDQISRGSGFTEKQSALAIKILQRHIPALEAFMNKNLSFFLENPTFRLPIRKISNEKRLSMSDDPVFGKVIKAVFPYSEQLVTVIRANKDKLGYSVWDKDEKCWIFSLSENSIQFLSTLGNFDIDESIQLLVNQLKEIHNDVENYVPMLVVEENVPKLKNCSQFVPELTTSDLLESVFQARKRGITTWDEKISDFLESENTQPLTKMFLKSDPGGLFDVDSELFQIHELAQVIAHLSPTLVVIPGGSEYANLVSSFAFFKNLGIDNKQMSVMFRLPTNDNELFNIFVRDNELNSPIDENTKVVFVSSKMPKPVLKSKIKFHSILNLGFQNVHYTMKDFLKNHENLITFAKKGHLRNTKFGLM